MSVKLDKTVELLDNMIVLSFSFWCKVCKKRWDESKIYSKEELWVLMNTGNPLSFLKQTTESLMVELFNETYNHVCKHREYYGQTNT